MRLTDSSEFEKVYRQGTAYRGKLFSVHAFPNGLGSLRLGLSVSKKVGNAVVRNTLRRRLREIFWGVAPGSGSEVDLVVSARPPAKDASFGELRDEFTRALAKLGVRDQAVER
ncbi:MAG: ribonuclease P protein component [Rubrobacter sp.]